MEWSLPAVISNLLTKNCDPNLIAEFTVIVAFWISHTMNREFLEEGRARSSLHATVVEQLISFNFFLFEKKK